MLCLRQFLRPKRSAKKKHITWVRQFLKGCRSALHIKYTLFMCTAVPSSQTGLHYIKDILICVKANYYEKAVPVVHKRSA